MSVSSIGHRYIINLLFCHYTTSVFLHHSKLFVFIWGAAMMDFGLPNNFLTDSNVNIAGVLIFCLMQP